MKHLPFLLIYLLSLPYVLLGNAAAPGIWGLGGSSDLTLFYKEDTLALDHIQMQEEMIVIELHAGYALVKGEYYMRNLDKKAWKFHTGYPVNSQNSAIPILSLDSLYALKVWVDGEPVAVKSLQTENTDYHAKNWFVWENIYKADTVTRLTVQYMVNTSHVTIRRGYKKEYTQGFAYLLESGGPWAKTIEKGKILVKLMDDLPIKTLKGMSPEQNWRVNEKKKEWLYEFTNLEPTAENNIIIKYGKAMKEYDISSALQAAEEHHRTLSQYNNYALLRQQTDTVNYTPYQPKDPFTLSTTFSDNLFDLVLLLAFTAPIWIPVLVFLLIAYLIWKKIVKKTSRSA